MPVDTAQFFYFLIVAVVVLLYLAMRKKKDGSGMPTISKGGSSTPFLNTYCRDFSEAAHSHRADPIIGREREIKKMIQVLSRRRKNNVLLLGEPGVGKTAIVEALAQRIEKNDVTEHLAGKRVLALDVAVLMSGTKYRGEFEKRAKKIVEEISHSNRSIILFIDEVHSVIQSKGTEGAIDFSDILKPALARGDLQMIGATTLKEYDKYIKTDLSLERRFQPITVDEPTEKEALHILKGIKDKYREYHKVEFTEAAITAAVKLTKKHIRNRKLPDKAIDALDESGAMVKVAHLHPAVPALLYDAAVKKHPDIAKLWKQIQSLDSSKKKAARESLEKKLGEKGVIVVDSDDVAEVIHGWIET